MGERELRKETVGRGELYFLDHPHTTDTFSGYGLSARPGSKEFLMVDRPRPADPVWLAEVEAIFGECRLVAMTAAGERGLACQMQVEPESQRFLRQRPSAHSEAIQAAVEPLLDHPPRPALRL